MTDEITYKLMAARTFDSNVPYPKHKMIGYDAMVMKYRNGKAVSLVGGGLNVRNFPQTPEEAIEAAKGKVTRFLDGPGDGIVFNADGTYHYAHVQTPHPFVTPRQYGD